MKRRQHRQRRRVRLSSRDIEIIIVPLRLAIILPERSWLGSGGRRLALAVFEKVDAVIPGHSFSESPIC
jgi:hypothetical protein